MDPKVLKSKTHNCNAKLHLKKNIAEELSCLTNLVNTLPNLPTLLLTISFFCSPQ